MSDVERGEREGMPPPSLTTITNAAERASAFQVRVGLFIREYLSNGCKAAEAYMAIYPDTKKSSAYSSAYELMRHPQFKDSLAAAIDVEFNRDTVRSLINERIRLTKASKTKHIQGVNGDKLIDTLTTEDVIIDNTAALALAANVLGMTKDQSTQGVSVTFNVAGLDGPVDVTVSGDTDTGATKQSNP